MDTSRTIKYILVLGGLLGIVIYITVFPSMYMLGFSVTTVIMALLSDTSSGSTIPYDLKSLYVALVMMTIILINLNILTYKYYSVGGFIGTDVWFHSKSSLLISRYGTLNILEGTKEYYFPLHHINIAMIKLIGNFDIKDAVFIIGGVVSTLLLSLFVYILIFKITNKRLLGVIGTILFLFTDFSFYWRLSPQTTSRGLFLFVVFLYSLYYLTTLSVDNRMLFVSVLLVSALIISHPTSSAITLILLSIGTLVLVLYTWHISRNKSYSSAILKIESIFLISFLAYNTFASKYNASILGTAFQNFLILFQESSEFRLQYIKTTSSLVVLYLKAGILSMYAISVYTFPMLARTVTITSHKKNEGMPLILSAMLIGSMLIGYGFPLLGLAQYLVGRVFVFMYLIVAMLFMITLTQCSPKFRKIAAALVIIGIIASVTDPVFNPDNPPFLKQYIPPEAVTLPQFYGAYTILEIIPSPENITTDYWAAHTVFYWWYKSKISADWWVHNPITSFKSNVSEITKQARYVMLLEMYKTYPAYVYVGEGPIVRSPKRVPYNVIFTQFIDNGCLIYSSRGIILGATSCE